MIIRAVFGAGGCGRGILPLVREQEEPTARCMFVDDALAGSQVNRADVLSFADFVALESDEKAICIAVAEPELRRRIAVRCRDSGLSFFTVQAAGHIAMDDVEIGEGSLISPFTTFTSNIRIGDHFHFNLYSYVEHDCVIGDYVTFAPAVRCNGNVTIGDHAYVGANAVIRQGLVIGANAIVGMGAVVTRNVPAGEVWAGNPARPMADKVK